jgi:thioredoxin reductase (NADPH)
MNTLKIKMYGANWCSDCRRTKNYLNDYNIPFEYIFVDDNDEASEYVIQLNNGKRIIPTLIINDVVYSNPSIKVLSKILEENSVK